MHVQFLTTHKVITGFVGFLLILLAIIIWQIVFIKTHGTPVAVPIIPRTTETFGSTGNVIKYAVIGDSTSIAQGALYDQGVARGTARYLARNHIVELTNYGISGARIADMRTKQLTEAAAGKPDFVLIAVAANDVTHLTSLSLMKQNMISVIKTLQDANPHVQIIMTGSPAMGSVERFAPPTKWIAGARVRQVNDMLQHVANDQHVILAPLAAETGRIFLHNPTMFAQDNFHPSAKGYAVWLPVIEHSIDLITFT